MGYSHYWEIKDSIENIDKEAMMKVVKIMEEHYDILCAIKEFPDSQPRFSTLEIIFNGKANNGSETFIFPPLKGEKFWSCKTNQKEYDIVVCEVLMVLKYYYKNLIRIATTGSSLDWHNAFNEITKFLPNANFFLYKGTLHLFELK